VPTARPRPPLALTGLTARIAVLFLIAGAVTGNYGAWGTGGALVIVAGILAYLRVRA
jgi:hypothetical protein